MKEIGFNWNKSKVLGENETIHKPMRQNKSYL